MIRVSNPDLNTKKVAFVRHGETDLNDDTQERLRSHLDVPLNDKGRQSAIEAGKKLAPVHAKTPYKKIYASDLGRSKETAQIIKQKLGGKIPIAIDAKLRPWDLGDLAGKKIKDVLPVMHKLIESPDEPAPNGESFNQFLQRFAPVAQKIIGAKDNHILIGHTRTAAALDAMQKNGGKVPKDLSAFKEKHPLPPGGIMFVGQDGKIRSGD